METAFSTWTTGGVRFLAVPHPSGVFVVDESGNSYGVWMSVESFRASLGSGTATILGKASVSVRLA